MRYVVIAKIYVYEKCNINKIEKVRRMIKFYNFKIK